MTDQILFNLYTVLDPVPNPLLLFRYNIHSNTNVIPYNNGQIMVKDCRSYGETQKEWLTWTNPTG